MAFGRASMLPLWPLDPAATYLNHGTVGVVPRPVLEAQARWRERIERHPARFMLRELWRFTESPGAGPTLLRQAAAEVARFVGARPEDFVFVDNTTTGVNAVVRSLPLAPGDEIVLTDQAYGGIVTAVHDAARRAGAVVTTVAVPYPDFDPEALTTRLSAALTPRTRMAIVDHVASETAIVMPVDELVRACHARGVPVLVDGAHAPGALALNTGAIGADVYVANLHKWAMAPRSSGFMVVAPALQNVLHPPVISWGYGRGFTEEFDWVGTRDPTPWLAAPDGIRFLESLDLEAVRRYNHALAWRAAQQLSGAWRMPLGIGEDAVGCMVSVAAPEQAGSTKADAARLRDALLFEDHIEVQAHARAGRVWIRASAQVYNDDADIERLERAVAARAGR
jgi:isopenicillin-N epimerase